MVELSREAHQVMTAAYQHAVNNRHELLTPEHILYAALKFDFSRQIFEACGVAVEEVKTSLDSYFIDNVVIMERRVEPTQSHAFQNVIERTMYHMTTSGKNEIQVGDILIALLEEPECFGAYYLKKAGITREALKQHINTNSYADSTHDDNADNERARSRNNATNRKRKLIEQYTTNLTAMAEAGELEPLIGREDILERTIQVLCRRVKNNPIHVGDPGVGKTAITEGLAQRIAEGKVPRVISRMQIYLLDMAGVLAGTRYRGDFEERLKGLIKELIEFEDAILFIDEIHTVIGAGAVSGGSLDASNILKPALVRGKLRCIGSTTFDEYKKHFAKDHALARRFQRLDVPPTTVNETVQIVQGLRHIYEQHHNVSYTEEALIGAVELSDLYINERQLPDKAVDVLDEAGAWIRIQHEKESGVMLHAMPLQIDRKVIETVVAKIANIPEKSVSTDEKAKLAEMEEKLRANVFGQEQAIGLVVEAIKRSRAGFRNPCRPISCLLFVGPTGVGKTELVRTLANELGIAFHRFDMSEYQERHAVSRLIGSPPGYVGYEEGGILTDAIRQTPHAVLLLDEIEKAHHDIYNILLQVMDYATLTDTSGRRADFRNVILVMTSNAGARDIGQSSIGFGDRVINDTVVHEAIKEIFSPEFRNRLDKVVVFNRLDIEITESIVAKEVEQFANHLKSQNITLEISVDAINWLAKQAYSPEFGARTVARIVEEQVKSHFIDQVLFGELSNGGTAEITCDDDELSIVFNSSKEEATVSK